MASYLILFQSLLLFLFMKFPYSAEQTVNFTYNGFGGANISLAGSAFIHPNGLLQLTNTSTTVQIGRAFHPSPLNFRNSTSGDVFSFTTSFISAIVPGEPNLSGHGIAFVISPSMDFPGSIGGQYMGLFNISNIGNPSNHVFLVELDTIKSPEFEGVDNNHVGIGLNSLKSNTSATAVYYDNEEGKNKSLTIFNGEPIQVWVDYDGVEKKLNVTVSPPDVPKPNRPLLSSRIDLSPIFTKSMFVGFSSATGIITGSHYILGWSFKMNGQSQPLNISILPLVPRRRESAGNQVWKIGLSLAVSVLVLVSAVGTVYIVRRKKYVEIREDWEKEYGPHRFSYKDLSIATKGFSDKELLGAGGFGRVYKGVLPASGVHVAVKVKRVSLDLNQGIKEFVSEIVSIGRLRHRNLVQLLGYCRRKGELMLVYDFLPNGSLDKFLFTNDKPILNWNQRYSILRGVASGLLYLHEEWEQIVLHRDIKASNVLLDVNLNGRLGDFGLARLYDHGTTPQTTQLVGTLGYLAPEFTRTGKATTSTDVFSFGAFLLEVACGRRPISLGVSSEEAVLVDWVFEYWRRGSIREMRDRRLGDEYVVEELELVLKLGLLCSHPIPEARPSMRQVMQYLNGDAVFEDECLDGVGPSMAAARIHQGFADFVRLYPASPQNTQYHLLSGAEPILFGDH
ncbi:L-type lectin-domain containing receptor kinase IV.1-like [Magnolia sinica]|uniref:L-type lectin-domain containing receptor kinase IV.1-like n=1 Tax=Magnolia sinica TaxID=86752 RepID=UPI0026596FAE|nr:L-type lectin-domain containing receptor kinase IV.1-like [Magnolia sinica]